MWAVSRAPFGGAATFAYGWPDRLGCLTQRFAQIPAITCSSSSCGNLGLAALYCVKDRVWGSRNDTWKDRYSDVGIRIWFVNIQEP